MHNISTVHYNNWKPCMLLCLFMLASIHVYFAYTATKSVDYHKPRTIIPYNKLDKYIIDRWISKEEEEPFNNNSQYFKSLRREDNVQKIFLISSNPRSGSTYTANILTAMPNSSYYFAPFWLNADQANLTEVHIMCINIPLVA